MKKPSIKEIFSIPNILSYIRIVLIPVFCYIYITAEDNTDYVKAFLIIAVSSITDFLDGKIARKFDMVTELGKIIDPVSDKLNHAAFALCLAFKYTLMRVLIVLMLVKEGYMAYMGIRDLKKGKMMNGAMWYGKVCTAGMFIGFLILLLFYNMPLIVANCIIITMMILMLFAFGKYIIFYNRISRDVGNK